MSYSENFIAPLEDKYQTYTFDFTMTADSDPIAIVCFSLGNIDKQITEEYKVWLDNVILKEVN